MQCSGEFTFIDREFGLCELREDRYGQEKCFHYSIVFKCTSHLPPLEYTHSGTRQLEVIEWTKEKVFCLKFSIFGIFANHLSLSYKQISHFSLRFCELWGEFSIGPMVLLLSIKGLILKCQNW